MLFLAFPVVAVCAVQHTPHLAVCDKIQLPPRGFPVSGPGQTGPPRLLIRGLLGCQGADSQPMCPLSACVGSLMPGCSS